MTPSRDTTDRKNSQPGYVYESDTVRRAYPANQGTTPSSPVVKMATAAAPPLLQSQQSVRAKDIPYHAREDSKPFTYGMVATNGHHHQENGSGGVANGATSSTPTSPSIHRRNWKESSSNMNNGQGQPKRLESPSLVRKFSNGSEQPVISPVRSAPRIPVPSIADPASPRPMRKLSESLLLNGGTGASSDNAASASAPNILPVATSSPRLDTSRNRSASSSASEMIKTPTPQLQHHISLEETIQDISTSPDSSRYVRFFSFFFSFRWAMPSGPQFRPSQQSRRVNCFYTEEINRLDEGNGSSSPPRLLLFVPFSRAVGGKPETLSIPRSHLKIDPLG